MTTSQQSFANGQTDVPDNPKYFIRHVVTSVAGASNLAESIQRIEGVHTLAGKTATLTFYAKADSAKNIAFDLYQYMGSGGSPSSDVSGIEAQQVSLTTSWQKFSIVVNIPSISGKTIGTDGNDSVQVVFWFDAGSTYDARTNSLGQQSGTFDIARVSLVEGDATGEDDPHGARHIQQELALCQRYYEKTNVLIQSSAWSTVANMVYFKVQKRAAPTLTLTAGGGTGGAFSTGFGIGDNVSAAFQNSAHSINSGGILEAACEI